MRSLAGCGLLLVLLSVGRVEAQDQHRARALFERARVAFDEGRLPEARELLQASLSTMPRPPTAINLARVQRSMGRLLAAEATLSALLEGRFGTIEGERRAAAEGLLAETRAEVGTLWVSVSGQPRARVTVDDVEAGVVSGTEPLEVRVDPGQHVIALTADDGTRARQAVGLGPGETRQVELTLLVAESPSPGEDLLESPWFWTIAGFGVAAGVVTAILLATIQTTADPITDPVFPIAQALRF